MNCRHCRFINKQHFGELGVASSGIIKSRHPDFPEKHRASGYCLPVTPPHFHGFSTACDPGKPPTTRPSPPVPTPDPPAPGPNGSPHRHTATKKPPEGGWKSLETRPAPKGGDGGRAQRPGACAAAPASARTSARRRDGAPTTLSVNTG